MHSNQFVAISYQLSVISYQLSVPRKSFARKTFAWKSVISYQLSSQVVVSKAKSILHSIDPQNQFGTKAESKINFALHRPAKSIWNES